MIKMKAIIKYIEYTAIFLLFLTFLPGIPPYIKFPYYETHSIIPLKGPLAPNNLLENAERLLENKVESPESIVIWKDAIYSGTIGGDIVSVLDEKIVAHIGPPCPSFHHQKRVCSYPLGMRFNDNGTLYVTDGNLGLFTVNVSTGDTNLLFTPGFTIEGEKLQFFDDLDLDNDGIVYVVITSTVAPVGLVKLAVLGGFNGLVIRYDPFHNETHILMKDLNGPVGIQVSKDQQYLLVCEYFNQKVLKYNLKGAKQGQTEVFLETPGACDNIRLAENGNFLLSIVNPALKEDIYDFSSNPGRHPLLRRLLARLLYILYRITDTLNYLFPNHLLYTIADNILYGEFMEVTEYGLVMEVDRHGEIIKSWHSPSGKMAFISQAIQHKEFLYLSSITNNYIGRVLYDE